MDVMVTQIYEKGGDHLLARLMRYQNERKENLHR